MVAQVEEYSRADDEPSITEKRKARGVRLMVETEDPEDNRNQSSNTMDADDEKMGKGASSEKASLKQPSSFLRRLAGGLRSSVSSKFQWVHQSNTRSKWKPVIRCALAAWVSGVLFLIPKIENAMGQVCRDLV